MPAGAPALPWSLLANWLAGLIQSGDMANWRQIQARIRKVKDTPEAATKLGELYAKTRDAMVAYELAAVEERAAHNDEAIRWYTTAHQRFRRQDWKRRVEEALTRLGAPTPEAHAGDAETHVGAGAADEGEEREAQISVFGEIQEAGGEEAHSEESEEVGSAAEVQGAAESPAESIEAGKKRRRRGRRGGRGRRRGPGAPALPAERFAPASGASPTSQRTPSRMPAPPRTPPRTPPAREDYPLAESAPSPRESFAARSRVPEPVSEAPMLPSERVAHGRGGDPAIASRLAHLESLLRRLLGSQLHSLDESDEAPAGPGVFLIADSDLVTSYYVESCKTLRIALGQLSRGGRGRRESSGPSFKSRLAEHLEISETKVADYLKKHCVVRWIQLDDEASHFANFVIGVLRTPLNAE